MATGTHPARSIHRSRPEHRRDDDAITVVRSGVQMPRTNVITKRWVWTCRREQLDRTSIWNQRHLLHPLPKYEHAA
jgi:hypothetical protein